MPSINPAERRVKTRSFSTGPLSREDAPCPRCGGLLQFGVREQAIKCPACSTDWVRPVSGGATVHLKGEGMALAVQGIEVGEVHRAAYPFHHAQFDEIPLRRLREESPWLRSLSGRNEWERQRALMRRLRLVEFARRPSARILRRLGLWTICRTNRFWFCTHHAYLYVVFAAAAGWTARILNIGRDEADTHGHMVVEVWNNELQKWILLDPLYAAWFSRRRSPREPLSSLEIRRDWISEHGRNLWLHAHVHGSEPLRAEHPMPAAEYRIGKGTLHPRGYFWAAAYLTNRFLSDPYENRDHLVLLWRDRHNAGRPWLHQGKPVGYHFERRMIEAGDVRDFHPALNNVSVWIAADKGRARAYVYSLGSNLARFEMDAGHGWRRAQREFALPHGCGARRLRIRAVNRFGVAGKPTTISLRRVRG